MTLAEDIEALAAADEVLIETSENRSTFTTVVWVVAVDGVLYVRSYLAAAGRWYQRASAEPRVALVAGDLRVEFVAVRDADQKTNALVTAAFESKYRKSKSLGFMVVPDVVATTMRLDPV